jgi:hypothetical protein
MVIAARFCAGLFGSQLLCATWLMFAYGLDLGAVATIGIAGSLFTLYCIVSTGRAHFRRRVGAAVREDRPLDLARTLWLWSTRMPPRVQAKAGAADSETLDLRPAR